MWLIIVVQFFMVTSVSTSISTNGKERGQEHFDTTVNPTSYSDRVTERKFYYRPIDPRVAEKIFPASTNSSESFEGKDSVSARYESFMNYVISGERKAGNSTSNRGPPLNLSELYDMSIPHSSSDSWVDVPNSRNRTSEELSDNILTLNRYYITRRYKSRTSQRSPTLKHRDMDAEVKHAWDKMKFKDNSTMRPKTNNSTTVLRNSPQSGSETPNFETYPRRSYSQSGLKSKIYETLEKGIETYDNNVYNPLNRTVREAYGIAGTYNNYNPNFRRNYGNRNPDYFVQSNRKIYFNPLYVTKPIPNVVQPYQPRSYNPNTRNYYYTNRYDSNFFTKKYQPKYQYYQPNSYNPQRYVDQSVRHVEPKKTIYFNPKYTQDEHHEYIKMPYQNELIEENNQLGNNSDQINAPPISVDSSPVDLSVKKNEIYIQPYTRNYTVPYRVRLPHRRKLYVPM